jgi:Tfp pilus assembly protein PilF
VLAKKSECLIYLGKYQEAADCADEGIKNVDQKNGRPAAEIRNVKAEALCYLGKYEDAIRYATEALKFDHDNEYSYYVKGLALNFSGKHEEALNYFDKAINNADYVASDVYTNKALALMDLMRYNDALACFDQAIKVSSSLQEKAFALINKAEILYKSDNKDKATKSYEEAIAYSDEIIANNQNASHSWTIKGISLFRLKWHDRAISCFDKAIEINPELDWAWYLKGLALSHLGKHEEALNYFDKAIEKNQNIPITILTRV